MVEVEVNVEVSVSYSPQYGEDGYASILGVQDMPYQVAEWITWSIEKTFERTEEEAKMGCLICPRKVIFEVDVTVDGDKIKDATCQTVCPAPVKAWVELEAMKQITIEKEKPHEKTLSPIV